MTKNIKYILAFVLINDFGIIYPLYTYFFKENNISIAQIAIILSALQFGKMIFDIPSGFIADLFGRRNLIIISQITRILFLSTWLFKPCFEIFLVSMFLWGMCLSCFFGNLEAMLYDQIETKNKDKYPKFLGILYAFQNLSIALAAFFSSLLNVKQVILGQILIYFISLFLAFLIKNDKQKNKTEEKTEKLFKSKDLLIYKKQIPEFLLLVLMEAFYIFSIDFNYNLMLDLGFSKEKIAIITGIFSFFKILINSGVYLFVKNKFFNKYYKYLYLVLISFIYLLNFVIFKNRFSILYSVLFYYIAYTIFSIKQTDAIQKNIKAEHRAIVMSFISFFISIFIIIFDMTIGQFKIYNGIFLVLTILITLTILILTISKRNLKTNLA